MTHEMKRGFWRSSLFAILFAAICHIALGQATTGQILGSAMDPTGAAIQGATITAVDEEKGVTFNAVTNGTGNYTLLNLPPSTYSITAEAPGFAPLRYQHVVLVIDQHAALDFHLKVGAASASVEVDDTPPVLQSQSAEVGTVIGGDAIVDLPLFGRNFYDLTNLVPGVIPGNGSNMNAFNLSVSGQREYSNSIQLDGIESTTNRTQDITIKPNVDSVEEFKVVTAAYNAEFGNAAGGVITVQTKAGTNAIHGDAYEFFRPPWMAARQTIPGVNAAQPEPTLRQHNYGGTVGGPILKDRAFYFFAYEGMRQDDTWNYVTSTLPSGLFNIKPNGDVDFSNLVDPCAGQQCTDNNGNPSGPVAGTVDPIYDPNYTVQSNFGWGPWSAQQFAGNVIPASRVSQAGINTIKNFFPQPNLTGTHNGWFRNFQAHTPEHQDSDQVDSRYDQVITPNDRLYTVFHWSKFNYNAQDAFYGHTVVPGAGDADQGTREDLAQDSVSVTYDHAFSPTALNEVRFGYLHYQQNQYSLLNGTDYSTKYGYGNVAIPGYAATIGFPDIDMADGYLTGGSSWKPFHIKDENYQLGDSFTWTRIARHEFKFGGDFRMLNSHPYFSLFPTGWQYYGSWGWAMTAAQSWWDTYDPSLFIKGAWNYLGGSDIADMVLGLPMDTYMGLQLTKPHTQSHTISFYGQDSWKITPRLTLNYGVRYEFAGPWTEEHNQMANYDLASGNIVLAGRNGVSKGLVDSRKDQFAPRFGFAYSLNPKTVLRGGGGVFFSPENDGREDYFTKNNPFALQYSFNNSDWVMANADPEVWSYQLDAGVPRSTAINIPSAGYIDPKNLANGNLEATYSIKPKIKTGTAGSYDLAIERQLSKSVSLDASYVGSLGRHLSYSVGDINANPALGSDPNGKTNYDTLITSYLGQIQYLTDSGNSTYNSLQVKLSQQATHNLSYLVSYTYGHNLDNGPAPFDLGNGNDRPQNPYDLKAEHSSSDADVRQSLVFSGDARLPFGRNEMFGKNWNPLLDRMLGGWKIGTIATMRTGTPVNIVVGNDPKSALAGLRPNVTKNPNLDSSKRSWNEWFDTTAFVAPAVPKGAAYAYGDAGRNIVKGPGYNNVDAQISKEFPFQERFKIQMRAEAFNLFNSVHLNNPDGDMQSGTFGQVTRAGSPRESQLAVKIVF